MFIYYPVGCHMQNIAFMLTQKVTSHCLDIPGTWLLINNTTTVYLSLLKRRRGRLGLNSDCQNNFEYFYDVIEGNDQLSSHMKWYFDTNISSSRRSYRGMPNQHRTKHFFSRYCSSLINMVELVWMILAYCRGGHPETMSEHRLVIVVKLSTLVIKAQLAKYIAVIVLTLST